MEIQKYIVYKTTNLVNSKFYIGVHRIGSSRKNYLGSGLNLKKAIKKYGDHNFIRETLFEFPTSKEAFEKEKEIVTIEFIKNNNCYNLSLGGCGGNLGESSNSKKRGSCNWMVTCDVKLKPGFNRNGDLHPLFGKKASDYMTNEGRKSLSEKTRARQLGSKNSSARKIIDQETGEIYNTIKEASVKTGINYSTLCANVNGRLKSLKRFKYLQ